MKDRSTLLNPKDYTEKQIEHIYHKWLYYYGGASDYCSLQEFINQYDSDSMGEINIYSIDMCPCVMCIGEHYD